MQGYSEIYSQAGWWSSMNWMAVGRGVRRLQERIYKAVREGNTHRAKELMKLLARSESTKLLSIYKVTQQNEGRTTPGIDGKVYLTAEARTDLSRESFRYRAWKFQPALRRYIPKGDRLRPNIVDGHVELRPLSIMTIKDRVMQISSHFSTM